MAKHVIIAPIGGDNDPIFMGIREFPTERVVLITEDKYKKQAEIVAKDLDRFKIPAIIEKTQGPIWEEIFRIVQETTQSASENEEVIINVASGNGLTNCIATSAAFVNGIKAFGMNDDGQVAVLPVLKFSYYSLLSDKKMGLLKLLAEDDCCKSLEELGRRAKMSLSLVSYHVNGNLKSDGLKQLGLVETFDKNGRVHIQLTTLGKLLLNGYV